MIDIVGSKKGKNVKKVFKKNLQNHRDKKCLVENKNVFVNICIITYTSYT